MKKVMMLVMAFILVALGSIPAFSFTDDFNRADSSDLGSNWTLQVGTIGVSGNQAASNTSLANYATVNGYTGDYVSTTVSVDVYDINQGQAYVALMFGIENDSESIFVKVQEQNQNIPGYFSNVGFYYGNNGGGTFFELDTPFSSGRISAWASDADTIWLGIDSNFDNGFEQTYSNAGWSSKILGTGIGLGMYGNVRADNFSTEGGSQGVPEPATMLLLGSGLIGLAGLGRKKLFKRG